MKIHPTASIDPRAELASEVEIGPFCVVGPRVTLGAGTRLLPHVVLVCNTTMGAGNVIHSGAVIGGDPQDKKFRGEETWVHMGDHNQVREHTTINRGTGLGGGETRIGNDCLVMASVHIAHDCIIGDRVTVASGAFLGGHVVVEEGAGLGGVVAVHHFVSIGRSAFVGGMSRIFSDAPPYMITEGVPSRVRALNRVGLHRSQVDEQVVAWLKEACRQLFLHDDMPKMEVIQRLRAKGDVPPEGAVLLDFVTRSINGKQGRALQP